MSMPRAQRMVVLPDEVYAEVRRHALRRGETTNHVIRQMLKLGLAFYVVDEHATDRILIEDANGLRELVPTPEGETGQPMGRA